MNIGTSSGAWLEQLPQHPQIFEISQFAPTNLLRFSTYRVFHVSLTFLIWLKMTLKCIVDTKARHFYNPEDPPFDMKHQLKSADPVPVVKIDLSRRAHFHYLFFPLSKTSKSVCKTLFFQLFELGNSLF